MNVNIGDKVKIINDCGCCAYGLIGIVESFLGDTVVVACDNMKLYCNIDWVESLPKTGLNLCELLKDNIGDNFFSVCHGKVTLTGIRGNRMLITEDEDGFEVLFYADGTQGYGYKINSVDFLLPSEKYYPEYILNGEKAWEIWQNRLNKNFLLKINYWCVFGDDITNEDITTLSFRTPSERDICINKIKEIINEYSE